VDHTTFDKTVKKRGAVDGKCKGMISKCGKNTVSIKFSATDKIRACARNMKYVS
jgi:hypothetical protein